MAEMGIYETMRTLRAVRRLRSDAIPDDVLHRVLEAATWAPTGGNVQPWRIVVVKDRALKEPLGKLYNERWVAYSKQYRAAIPASASPEARARARTHAGRGRLLGHAFRRDAGRSRCSASIRKTWLSRTRSRSGFQWSVAARFTPRSRTCCWRAAPKDWAAC